MPRRNQGAEPRGRARRPVVWGRNNARGGGGVPGKVGGEERKPSRAAGGPLMAAATPTRRAAAATRPGLKVNATRVQGAGGGEGK